MLEPGASDWLLNVYGTAEGPIAIDITTEMAGLLAARITDTFLGLPSDAGIDIQPLPDVTYRTLIEHTVTVE